MKCICTNCASAEACTTEKCFQELWLFEGFSKEQLLKLKEIGLKKTIRKGEPVFMQGEKVKDLFLIKAGRIKLNKVQEDGNEITLDFRKAGDVLGETVFADDMDYPVSAWALEDTVTCGIEIQAFNRLILDNPDIGLKVIRSMGRQMASMGDRLESMSGSSLEERLYSVLSHVAKEHGTEETDGFSIGFPLTHEELGFLVGAHRVSVTKAMKALAESGKITKQGKKLTLTHTFS